MSDRTERACTRCGSFLHHEDDAHAVRDHLKRADGQFRAADEERNALAVKCNELGVRLDDAIAKLDEANTRDAAAVREIATLTQALNDVRSDADVRLRAARALYELGSLDPEHVGGCPADEPCDCPEYVLVGAVTNDEIKVDVVEVAIAAAHDVSDVE